MLPIADKLDQVGFWALESWGGATFDACVRFLGEDPWERIRRFKAAMPNTRQQMLFRGQSILGYRHYADDVVRKFVERAAINGVDVFRVFDALNDMRNLETPISAIPRAGGSTPRARWPIPLAPCTLSTLGSTWRATSKAWAPIRFASRTWRACSNPTTLLRWFPSSSRPWAFRFISSATPPRGCPPLLT